MKTLRVLWLALLFCMAMQGAPTPAATGTPTEDQVKAVFVFNFTLFTEWPAATFSSPTQPLVIGVLGSSEFAGQLDEVVRGERVGEHPLQVRQIRDKEAIRDCHVLYVDRTEGSRLAQALDELTGAGTLSISDVDGAARRGTMVEFAKRDNRIRLLVNVDSARAAGLTISSKLLRPAQIVRTERD